MRESFKSINCKEKHRGWRDRKGHIETLSIVTKRQQVKSMANYLKHNSRLFQQVGSHVSPNYTVLLVKPNLNVLPKATAVVIPCCFGIPKGLNKIYIKISTTFIII